MNFVTQILHLVGSGASAYITAHRLRDSKTRPNMLAALQLIEAGSVPYLRALRDRAAAEQDPWLADKLTDHAQDEEQHAKILAYALKLLNKQVVDPSSLSKDQPNESSKDRRQSPFFAAYFDGYAPEQLKPERVDWIVFLANTYILELDACQDFVRMAHALPTDDPACTKIKQGLLSIAKDEKRHAAYLLEALHRRMSELEVREQIDTWRTRKVNALLAMATSFLQKRGEMPALARDDKSSDVFDPLDTPSSAPPQEPVIA